MFQRLKYHESLHFLFLTRHAKRQVICNPAENISLVFVVLNVIFKEMTFTGSRKLVHLTQFCVLDPILK